MEVMKPGYLYLRGPMVKMNLGAPSWPGSSGKKGTHIVYFL